MPAKLQPKHCLAQIAPSQCPSVSSVRAAIRLRTYFVQQWFKVGLYGSDISWPRLDEGHCVPNPLEHRYGNYWWMQALQLRGVAA